VFGEEPAPGLEGPVRSDAERAAFVGCGDEPEQQLCAGVVEWCEPEFVDQDQVVSQQGVDPSSDGVVGQSAVEVLDELGGGEVSDSVSVLDGGDAEGDEHVGFPGAGGPDEADVLRGTYPFQGGEVVERRLGERGGCDVEVLEGLGDRERCLP